MRLILKATALAALSTAYVTPVVAQRLSPTVVAVVDTDRIARECTACRAAQTQLQSQATALQARQQALSTPLQPERDAIATAVNALNGRQPDAALTARINAFRQREATANQELTATAQRLRSTEAHVSQQIGQRLRPIIDTVRDARGAALVVDRGAVLSAAPAIDITVDVLTRLNQQLPSVSVTPLPQPAQPAQPQGR